MEKRDTVHDGIIREYVQNNPGRTLSEYSDGIKELLPQLGNKHIHNRYDSKIFLFSCNNL